MRKEVLLVLLVSLVMVGCGTDPRDAADAYRIRMEADAAATQQAQQVQITADRHDQEMKEAQLTMAETVAARQRLVRYGSIGGVTAILVILAATVFLYIKYAPRMAQAAEDAARAMAQAMELRSRLIMLDQGTHQYPLLLQPLGGGKFSLADANSDQVLLLDAPHEPNQLKSTGQAQVQALGVLADAAKRSNQSGTLSALGAPVINAMEVSHVSPDKAVKVYRARK